MMSEPTGTPAAGSSWSRTHWRRTSARPVYDNHWISVREDVVELPNGRSTVYGVVECSECVGVLPFLDRDTVLLVGQYRYVAGDFFWEIPTGGQHAGETPTEAAQRELAEEAGHEAGRPVRLGDFPPPKSILRGGAPLYVAGDLRPAARPPAPPQVIE